MIQFRPKKSQPQVRYFYLPPINGKLAEIIQVLNCTSPSIQIPVREEDVELSYFFQRDMTNAEIASFGENSAWRIFYSWSELRKDHVKNKVKHKDLEGLAKNQIVKELAGKVAAWACE